MLYLVELIDLFLSLLSLLVYLLLHIFFLLVVENLESVFFFLAFVYKAHKGLSINHSSLSDSLARSTLFFFILLNIFLV